MQVVTDWKPTPKLLRLICRECGHVANVSADCTYWACRDCGRIQLVRYSARELKPQESAS